SSRSRHTRCYRDWSSDVCSSDLYVLNNITAGPLWQKSSGTTVGMMPAYDPTFGDGGTLFIYGGGRLYAADPATGSDRWPSVAPRSEERRVGKECGARSGSEA